MLLWLFSQNAALAHHLSRNGFEFVDCQITTPHLVSMGAVEIPRQTFLSLLKDGTERPDISGPWTFSGFNRDTIK